MKEEKPSKALKIISLFAVLAVIAFAYSSVWFRAEAKEEKAEEKNYDTVYLVMNGEEYEYLCSDAVFLETVNGNRSAVYYLEDDDISKIYVRDGVLFGVSDKKLPVFTCTEFYIELKGE